MLVLKVDMYEEIDIDKNIKVVFLGNKGRKGIIGISAPIEISIKRKCAKEETERGDDRQDS